jgi:alanine racemase
VGMQTAFVELAGAERAGDEVVLLGDGVTVEQLAPLSGCNPHEVLLRMAGSGPKRHVGP